MAEGRDEITLRCGHGSEERVKAGAGGGLGQDLGIFIIVIFCILLSFLMNGSVGLNI